VTFLFEGVLASFSFRDCRQGRRVHRSPEGFFPPNREHLTDPLLQSLFLFHSTNLVVVFSFLLGFSFEENFCFTFQEASLRFGPNHSHKSFFFSIPQLLPSRTGGPELRALTPPPLQPGHAPPPWPRKPVCLMRNPSMFRDF